MSMNLKEFDMIGVEPKKTKEELVCDFLSKNQRAYTTPELIKELKINQSTVRHSLKNLRKKKKVVMKEYKSKFYYAIKH